MKLHRSNCPIFGVTDSLFIDDRFVYYKNFSNQLYMYMEEHLPRVYKRIYSFEELKKEGNFSDQEMTMLYLLIPTISTEEGNVPVKNILFYIT